MKNTILLIEDNLEIAENISTILELARYSVIHAPNGKTGVALAQQNLPDLILCDIMMPEMDGYTVLHILSKMEETSSIPFIFLTAKSEISDFRAGMNLGADDYISKPFDGVDLLKVVELRLRKKVLRPVPRIQDDLEIDQQTKNLEEFKSLNGNRTRRIFRRKDLIYMEGQNPNHLFFILRGQVKTFKVNHFGKELIIDIHEKNAFLGYLPLLEDKPYNENAEALTDVEISVIPRSDFLALMNSNREVADKFIKMLSHNLEEMENRLLDIAYQSVRQRVAGTLLKLGKQYTENAGNSAISIARRNISSLVGTTTESLNRTLADFKDEKLIEINPDGLKILNLPQLERIVNL